MLLRLTPEKLEKLLEGYEKECAGIRKNALTLSWYMRGGISYIDALNMSELERKLIGEIIEQNLEVTKNSQLPFF